MSRKVTVSFGNIDESKNSINLESPIEVYKTVDTIEELYDLPNESDFPEYNPTYFENENKQPLVVVYVNKLDKPQDGYTGAYFKYNFSTQNWKQILVGTHSHDNKMLLDKMSDGDVGQWLNASSNYGVQISDSKPTEGPEAEGKRSEFASFLIKYPNIGYDANTGNIHFDREEEKLYTAIRRTEGLKYFTTWHVSPVKVVDRGEFPAYPNEKDIIYMRTDGNIEEQIYVFTGAAVGESRVMTMEITETGAVYDYNIKWETLPERLPEPIIDSNKRLYLSVDSRGRKKWVNDFVPGQSFAILNNYRIEDNTLVFSNIEMNSEYDEVLTFAGKLFVRETQVYYEEEVKELRVQLTETIDENDSYSVMLIRNTVNAVLAELAKNYITKDEYQLGTSGDTIDSLKKQIQGKSDVGHTHTEYSRVGHNHDNLYARIDHTHSQYMTEGAVLRLLSKELSAERTGPILETLSEIQNFLDSNSGTDLSDALASKTDINDLGLDLAEFKDEMRSKLDDYIPADQIVTDYVTPYKENKTLDVLLREILDRLEMNDISGLQSTEIGLGKEVQVTNPIGLYRVGDLIEEQTKVSTIIERMFKKRAVNEEDPKMELNLKSSEYLEMGTVNFVNVSIDFTPGLSTGINEIRMYNLQTNIEYGRTYNSTEFTAEIPIEKESIAVRVLLQYELPEGGEASLYEDITFIPRRALFYSNIYDEEDVRSEHRVVLENYKKFDHEIIIPSGSDEIVISVPDVQGAKLDSIIYNTLNQEIFGLFDEPIPGLLKFDILGESLETVPYNVYRYKLPVQTESELILRVIQKG